MRGLPEFPQDGGENGFSPGNASNSPHEEFVEMNEHTMEDRTGRMAKRNGRMSGVVQRTDEELFASYQEREESAVFSELVSRYQRDLYNYLRRFLGDASVAEDVFQATFLQVHLKRDKFELGRKFRPWLYTIATHQAIDWLRRNRRHRRLSLDQTHRSGSEVLGSLMDALSGGEQDPSRAAEQIEHAQWVRDAVEALPEPLRHAVNLVYFRGMKYGDAAKVMSIPVGTVKSRLHSALRRLGDAWHNPPSASS
jgi:RNA polymerase sigma-70 factor (ECF subfamily)